MKKTEEGKDEMARHKVGVTLYPTKLGKVTIQGYNKKGQPDDTDLPKFLDNLEIQVKPKLYVKFNVDDIPVTSTPSSYYVTTSVYNLRPRDYFQNRD